jgi:hypothetical protein
VFDPDGHDIEVVHKKLNSFCACNARAMGCAAGGGRAAQNRKAETKGALLAIGFRDAYALRPGFIQPMRGSGSRNRGLRWMYGLLAPFYPFLQRRLGRFVTSTDLLGSGHAEACRR